MIYWNGGHAVVLAGIDNSDIENIKTMDPAQNYGFIHTTNTSLKEGLGLALGAWTGSVYIFN